MREILFRGKRKDNGEWVEGYYAWYGRPGAPFIGFNNSIGTMMWCEVDPATIGQYTGLKDKNGKRIFEGDCLGHPHNVVEYLDGGFCVAGDRPLWLMAKHLSVIGNIHDNQELLKGE